MVCCEAALNPGLLLPPIAYQHQFVKTRLRRVWSNRDMGLFSFRPISPQFAKESPPKPLKSVHPSGSHFGGPFSMLQARFLDYLGAFLCNFCGENVFSETIFQYFLHFQFVKTRSRRQKVAKATETGFDKLLSCQKRWERGFNKDFFFIAKSPIPGKISVLFSTCGPPKYTNTWHLTITLLIQAV